MLLSEWLNNLLRSRKFSLRLDEGALVLACGRCGRTVRAPSAIVEREGPFLIYRCPSDRAALVSVGFFDEGSGDVGFHDGSLRIRVAGENIAWEEFMRELLKPQSSTESTLSFTVPLYGDGTHEAGDDAG